MKVVALMSWEWQAGDPEKYWQGWQWDGKPGADYDSIIPPPGKGRPKTSQPELGGWRGPEGGR